MCRMTVYRGDPIPAALPVFEGSHSLARQSWDPRELIVGSINVDGWGVVWYDQDEHSQGNGPRRLARAAPIWHDTDAEQLLRGVRGRIVMAAVRNATAGLTIGPDGVAPFVHAKWSFMLNGFVPSFRPRHMRTLRRGLPDDLYGCLAGSTDVETLLLLAVAHARKGATLGESLEHVARTVRARVDPTGETAHLTMAFSDGQGTAVVRTSNAEAVNTLYRIDRAGMARNGTLFASEPIDESPEWGSVPVHTVIELTDEGEQSWAL